MKKLILLLLLLTGCAEAERFEEVTVTDRVYIVAGQSNATNCDWSYFEAIAGVQVYNIAHGGHSIDDLLQKYEYLNTTWENAAGIIFVHGETDGRLQTHAPYYVERVEYMRQVLSDRSDADLTMFISSVGYYAPYPDAPLTAIRDAVKAYDNDRWVVAYDDAQFYRDQGLLLDGVHFTPQGCEQMMDAIAEAI